VRRGVKEDCVCVRSKCRGIKRWLELWWTTVTAITTAFTFTQHLHISRRHEQNGAACLDTLNEPFSPIVLLRSGSQKQRDGQLPPSVEQTEVRCEGEPTSHSTAPYSRLQQLPAKLLGTSFQRKSLSRMTFLQNRRFVVHGHNLRHRAVTLFSRTRRGCEQTAPLPGDTRLERPDLMEANEWAK